MTVRHKGLAPDCIAKTHGTDSYTFQGILSYKFFTEKRLDWSSCGESHEGSSFSLLRI
jgi:hypothetical protein